jgi:Tol biopolymer transport system component
MKKGFRNLWIGLLVLAVGLLVRGEASAGAVKVSGTLPDFAAVADYAISPNGQYLVYTADAELDGAVNLYRVALPGGQPVRIGPAMPAGTGVTGIQISPDSLKVVYLAPTSGPGALDLYSARLDQPGQAPVQLTQQQRQIFEFAISSDSQWVVFLSDSFLSGIKRELYAVPLNGPISAGRKLNSPILTPDGLLESFQISPDSQRVAYLADAEVKYKNELYSVPLATPGEAVKVSLELPWVGVGWDYIFSPDGSFLIYRAVVLHSYELFRVPAAGPASHSVRLSPPLKKLEYRTERLREIQVSPDGQWVVFELHALDEYGEYDCQLWSVPLAGPREQAMRLHAPFGAEKGVWSYSPPSYWISPDSQRVVFIANVVANVSSPNLYSVPIRGPEEAVVKLNTEGYPQFGLYPALISPDSQWVVFKRIDYFQGKSHFWNPAELIGVPITGPAEAGVRLTGPFPTNGMLIDFAFSADSQRVLFLAEQFTPGLSELFSVPRNGPAQAAVKLNGSPVSGGMVHSFAAHPTSSWVVYQADQERLGKLELYLADDGQTEINFSPPPADLLTTPGLYTFEVQLSQPAVMPVTVSYGVSGSQGSPGFQLQPGTLTFQPGETVKLIELYVLDDPEAAQEETLTLILDDPSNAALGDQASLTLRIVRPEIVRLFLPWVGR